MFKTVLLAAGLAVLLVGLAPQAHAKARHRHRAPAPVAPAAPRTFSQAVEACRTWLRAHGHTAFDVYVYRGTVNVQPYGTAWDVYTFDKCMNDKGYALVDLKPGQDPRVPAVVPTRTPIDVSGWPIFRDACQKISAPGICTCVWRKMVSRYAQEDLQQLTDGTALAGMADECMKEVDL